MGVQNQFGCELIESLSTALLDKERISKEEFRPQLLVNNYEKGQKVLTSLIKELEKCSEFYFSVAFITQSGVTVLLNVLKDLEDRGIKGKIVASQYLNFTDPKALRKLKKFKNIELKVAVDRNFHAKGYLFKKDDVYSLVIGSSNLTQEALSRNQEWNIKLSSGMDGSLIEQINYEFSSVFENAQEVTEQWLNQYEQIYKSKNTPPDNDLPIIVDSSGYNGEIEYGKKTDLNRVMPNSMQINALEGIAMIREANENKALLISATGTGKTYLSAFDVKTTNPERFLFIAHREQILKQSIKSYKEVLGYHIDAGLVGGGHYDFKSKYVFSTVNMMSRDNVIDKYQPNHFDYIVIDESHRSGAKSYQKIINHFRPRFLLGMTATPERTDGFNICRNFDYNIAYEIRLKEAMHGNMLCPFHYFGISEIRIDGNLLSETTSFNHLVSEQRVDNIIEMVEFYGYHGVRVKGLIFCSRNEEAEKLSGLLNSRGYRTVALSGDNSQEERETAIDRLTNDDCFKENEALDYILTVDIFNEGVDIPEINQIIMLRPTQSAIIFVQQLGRGLRKYPNKDYVIILDFIGNYSNNFMIPMALSDDRSYNKDTIRRYTLEGSRVIPGCSTINFDEISRKKIFESIDNVSLTGIKYIKEAYTRLKNRIGRIPTLMDFENHDSIDLALLFSSKTISYYAFLKRNEKEFNPILSDFQELIIRYISKRFAAGKRPHELLVIQSIMNSSENIFEDLRSTLENDYKMVFNEIVKANIVNVLTSIFPAGAGKKTYQKCIIIREDMDHKCGYVGSDDFIEQLKNDDFRKHLTEIIEYGLFRNQKYYPKPYKDTTFQLYKKYSYYDVCWLLNWENEEVPLNIGGYKYNDHTKTYPVFINYHKTEDINATIKYEDRFISPSQIIALSKSKRTKDSNDVDMALHAAERGVAMHLFVRKNKDDSISKEFYYLGRICATGEYKEVEMADTKSSAVEITYHLEQPVQESLYDYLTDNKS